MTNDELEELVVSLVDSHNHLFSLSVFLKLGNLKIIGNLWQSMSLLSA